jgi:hypothetical protein
MSFMDRDMLSGAPSREDRRARLVRGCLRQANGAVIPIVIRNLSERGLGVTCKSAPPARGEAVFVTLPGSSELPGVVRWTRNTAFGIELTCAVDATEIAGAIKRKIGRLQQAADWKVSSLHRVHTPHATGPRRRI